MVSQFSRCAAPELLDEEDDELELSETEIVSNSNSTWEFVETDDDDDDDEDDNDASEAFSGGSTSIMLRCGLLCCFLVSIESRLHGERFHFYQVDGRTQTTAIASRHSVVRFEPIGAKLRTFYHVLHVVHQIVLRIRLNE